MIKIEYYKTKQGKAPFLDWLNSLDMKIQDVIIKRIYRLENKNYGDCKRLKNGLIELRFNFGAGYRIYFIEVKNIIILLLYGGDKKTQQRDIKRAMEYIKEYKRRVAK